MDFKKEIAKSIQQVTGRDIEEFLEVPPDPKLGDYALPCFELSKSLKKNPAEIALDLARKIKSPLLEKAEAKGPYLNLFINKKKFADAVIKKIFKDQKNYGAQKHGQRIMLEFPSPNTNKPLHLGHLRNIALGQSFQRILSFTGNKVVAVNLNNDRGIHICKSMLAYMKWGKNKNPDKKPKQKPDHFVGDFYVLYNKHETDNLYREAQELLQKWEAKDKTVRKLWKIMNSWALKGFDETYKKLDLKFDRTYNESQIYMKAREIVDEGISKGLFYKDKDGAMIANLDVYDLGKKVILRPDGTTIYITQDLYLAKKKFEDFKIDRSIYIVGSEQVYHFKVLFLLLELLGYDFAKHCYHLSYGMVNLPEGKMKSREGTVVDADDIIQEMEDLALAEIKKRYKLSKAEEKRRSRIIAMAALRYFLLKYDTDRDMMFNPAESISFEGETGPYIQYAYARIKSILRKHGKKVQAANFKEITEKEAEIIKLLEIFPNIVENAEEELKPSVIARYLLKLAQEFNNFYINHPVLKAEQHVMKSRLALITAVASVLKIGLGMLHIDVLEEM